MQVRPSGVERAGTTDPERSGGVPEGGIVVGLDKGKYMPDARASCANRKPTWKRVSDQLDFDGSEYRFRECPRVPYRLPKVLAADTVFLPEGEKDVATLEDWGLVASCNPGGSGGSHLYGGWLDHFRHRHIVILPDNDAPGRKHAAAAAEHLLPVAASLQIVELPGLPARGDVTDWKQAGGTLEQFRALVSEAPPLLDAQGLAELKDRWGLAKAATERPTRAQVGEEWPTPESLAETLPPVLPFNLELLPEAFRTLVADASWVVVPNLWGGIIAPPGFMKSPVMAAMVRPLWTSRPTGGSSTKKILPNTSERRRSTNSADRLGATVQGGSEERTRRAGTAGRCARRTHAPPPDHQRRHFRSPAPDDEREPRRRPRHPR